MSKAISIDYTAPPVLAQFMRSNARIRFVRGPIGSGKSTAMVIELFRRMLEQAPGPDGIRRTRMAVVRNTGVQLRTTCLVTIMQLLRGVARWKPSTQEVIFRFGDVESSWLMLPLDTPANVNRLLSLELTCVWVSEAREVLPSLVDDAYSRCGRFPSELDGGPSWYGLIAETNSFSEDSPWCDRLEYELPENWEYFIQPPGVTVVDEDNLEEFPKCAIGDIIPTGENVEHLQKTYYTDQITSKGGLDAPWVRQYVLNEVAPSLSGEAVFRKSFNYNAHVSVTGITPTPSIPLCIGLDTGRNPAAVITQIDPTGRMLVLGEASAANCGMELFVNEHLVPLLYSERYAGLPIYLVIDPAGIARNEIGEESVLMALQRLGFAAVTAQTNKIAPRLRAVEKWMQLMLGGRPALRIDQKHCPMLILGLSSRYRYKRKKDGELDEINPDKVHPFSDYCDALQYACLGGSTTVRARAMRKLRPHRDTRKVPHAGGWT